MATGEGRSLETTPTWALATVAFIFIFLGLLIEYTIHLAGHWLKKHKKNSMWEAMEKLKTLLMQLGFMSIILTVTQRAISNICISINPANSMLPCQKKGDVKPDYHDHCVENGKVSLMSADGINQLNIFIFVLAAMQVVYCLLTMLLGNAKMRSWKTWEQETQTVEYRAANDPERFRFTRETSFTRRHIGDCASTQAQLWIKCFFQQFFQSVDKGDYFTLRHAFISAHLSGNNSFNFRKYIQRSLENDFKDIIGISPVMWFVVVIFLLVDVHGWNVYLWVSFLPLIVVLLVGSKLEVILARMAMHLADHKTVIRGAILVQLDDNLFWFNKPQLILKLLHLILFTNAFEFSFFIWVSWQFGINSCYHENVGVVITRVVLAVVVQVICSYVTLPLYALVTQMGSEYKSSILEEGTKHAIKTWHKEVKQKRKKYLKSPNSAHQDDSSSHNKRFIASSEVSVSLSLPQRSPSFIEFFSRGEATKITKPDVRSGSLNDSSSKSLSYNKRGVNGQKEEKEDLSQRSPSFIEFVSRGAPHEITEVIEIEAIDQRNKGQVEIENDHRVNMETNDV